MRSLIAIISIALLPIVAQAQLIVEKGKAVSDAVANDTSLSPRKEADDGKGPVEAVIQGTNFPANAITDVGTPSNSEGRSSAAPANIATRKIIAADSPLWPTDTVDIFVTACAAGKHQAVGVCRCVIEKLALKMPHNEFIKLSEADAVEKDPRYISARASCLPQEQRTPSPQESR
jgi:hypothetical protein